MQGEVDYHSIMQPQRDLGGLLSQTLGKKGNPDSRKANVIFGFISTCARSGFKVLESPAT